MNDHEPAAAPAVRPPWRADDHPPHSWPIGQVDSWRNGHGCPTIWCKGEGTQRDATYNTRKAGA